MTGSPRRRWLLGFCASPRPSRRRRPGPRVTGPMLGFQGPAGPNFAADCHGGGRGRGAGRPRGDGGRRTSAVASRIGRRSSGCSASGRCRPGGSRSRAAHSGRTAIQAVEAGLRRFIEEHRGDPGPVAIRRLTGAEYGYTLRDLTGLDLQVGDDFVSDAVAGEGFANAGDGQFMQDSTLERYLEAAKAVADHAVIGRGRSGSSPTRARPGASSPRSRGSRRSTASTASARPRARAPSRSAWTSTPGRCSWPGNSAPATASASGSDPAGSRPARGAERPALRAPLGRPESGGIAVPALADPRGLAVAAPARGAERRRRCACAVRRAGPGPPRVAEDARRLRRRRGGGRRPDGGRGPGRRHAHPDGRPELAEGREVAGFELSVSRASKDPADAAVVVWRNPRVRFRREDRRRDGPGRSGRP